MPLSGSYNSHTYCKHNFQNYMMIFTSLVTHSDSLFMRRRRCTETTTAATTTTRSSTSKASSLQSNKSSLMTTPSNRTQDKRQYVSILQFMDENLLLNKSLYLCHPTTKTSMLTHNWLTCNAHSWQLYRPTTKTSMLTHTWLTCNAHSSQCLSMPMVQHH